MKILNIRGECASRSLQAARTIAKQKKKKGYSVKTIPQAHYELFLEITGLEKKKIDLFLDLFHADYLILEGELPVNAPNLVVSLFEEDFENELTIASIAEPGMVDEKLLEILVEKVIDRMPNFTSDCCSACGFDCKVMTKKILGGSACESQCILKNKDVQVFIDGKAIPMVPFVKRLVRNVSTSVVKELDGYHENCEIEIKINR